MQQYSLPFSSIEAKNHKIDTNIVKLKATTKIKTMTLRKPYPQFNHQV